MSAHSMASRTNAVLNLLVTEGLSDKEIGDRLHISPQTVRNHITTLLQLYGVESRSKLIVHWHTKPKLYRAHDHR